MKRANLLKSDTSDRSCDSIPQMAPEEWNEDVLARRQREMAKRAAHVWRVDFG